MFTAATIAVALAHIFAVWRALKGPTVFDRVLAANTIGTAAILLWSLSAAGWATVLISTFLIDHFQLFGLTQVVRHFRGLPEREPAFVERAFYRFVRHPLMTGFLIAFWSTPYMTQGHLFFAVMCTGYILIGTRVEERDLISAHGASYLDYKRRVPGLIPMPRRAS